MTQADVTHRDSDGVRRVVPRCILPVAVVSHRVVNVLQPGRADIVEIAEGLAIPVDPVGRAIGPLGQTHPDHGLPGAGRR